MPGGFGVAKNFCNFAVKGKDMTVFPEIEKILKDFHKNKKPIAAACISPILLAWIFPNCTVTLGKVGEEFPYSDSIKVAKNWGVYI